MSINIKEKFAETKKIISIKWKKANEKYPWLKPVLIGCGIALVGGGTIYLYNRDRKSGVIDNWLSSGADDISCDKLMHDHTYAGQVYGTSDEQKTFEPSNGNFDDDNFKTFWELNYKDNWDEVMECVKRLSLKPGEMFIIEDQQQYANPIKYPDTDWKIPVVSHLVDNVGVYPPEE